MIRSFSRIIKTGLIYNVELRRIKMYVKYFWQRYLRPHFLQEEAILFASRKHAEVQRALIAHSAIAQQIKVLNSGRYFSSKQLLALADSVDDLVRYEESELLPQLQIELTEVELTFTATEITACDDATMKDVFPYEGWIHQRSCYTGL